MLYQATFKHLVTQEVKTAEIDAPTSEEARRMAKILLHSAGYLTEKFIITLEWREPTWRGLRD